MKQRQSIPADYRKLSDEELVHRYASKREQVAINCLFERYGHLVFGVCLKYLKNNEAAKDATQQIFIKLLDDLVRFKIDKFKPWFFQTVKNHCLMQTRRSIQVQHNELETAVEMEDEGWQHKIEQEHLLNKLEQAVKELSSEQRTCIELFYLQEHTYSSIAEKTGSTLQKVKSAIQNGRRNLKLKLQGTGKAKES